MALVTWQQIRDHLGDPAGADQTELEAALAGGVTSALRSLTRPARGDRASAASAGGASSWIQRRSATGKYCTGLPATTASVSTPEVTWSRESYGSRMMSAML